MDFEMPTCGGCRTCEMACSFHHQKSFSPEISSIRILEKKDGAGYNVWIADREEGKRMACDGCVGIEVPLCVQFCKSSEELLKILEEVEKVRQTEKVENVEMP